MNHLPKVDVVTIGESMVLFQPALTEGAITYAPLFAKSVGGAESNVAMALTRLGKKVRWISRLGDDPFGDMILSTLAGEGVDVSYVIKDQTSPTAVFFKESKGYGDPNVYYYRKHSAASKLSDEDMKLDWFKGARHLHITGITPALGENTTMMVQKAMIQAKEQGLTVSYDPNLRKKLWGESEARETLLSYIPYCDIFMPGIEEAEFLIGEKSPEQFCEQFQEMGVKVVLLKLGTNGSMAKFDDTMVKAEPYRVETTIDTVGAGDAFAAGFLSVFLDDEQPLKSNRLIERLPDALKRANIMGALATQFKGDWEGNPTLSELERIEAGKQHVTR
ncbi:sugar kinase [Evansella halocellulosilytica]|uniref:sugar kinase n=1 Tax=Evansella halocellulosilytica TaxID=2011013 RepID=UPI000BB69D86|nr:sugar kinase [Evansella halocellulosilytica]